MWPERVERDCVFIFRYAIFRQCSSYTAHECLPWHRGQYTTAEDKRELMELEAKDKRIAVIILLLVTF